MAMATTLEVLNKVVRKKGGALAYAWIADMEWESGNQDYAIEIAEKGNNENPNYVPGMLVRVKGYRHHGLHAQAESMLQRILELDPMNLAAQKWLIETSLVLGKTDVAANLLGRIRELDALATDLPEISPEMAKMATNSSTLAAPSELISGDQSTFIESDALFASLDDSFAGDEDDEKSAKDLQMELEAALAAAPVPDMGEEYFPADDTQAGGAVGSMITSLFGEAEATSRPDQDPVPAEEEQSVPPVPQAAPVVETIPEAPAPAPAPKSLFSSFGSDEPVAKPATESLQPRPNTLSNSLFEKAPELTSLAPKEPLEKSSGGGGVGGMDLASALDDLFGEDDDLPIESPTATRIVSETPTFESTPEVKSPIIRDAGSTPDNDLQGGLADALDGLFGEEDDLPVESPLSTKQVSISPEHTVVPESRIPIIRDTETSPENDLQGGLADALDGLFGEKDDLPEENIQNTIPVVEAAEKPASIPESANNMDNSLTVGVSDALDGLFGEEESLAQIPEAKNELTTGVEDALSDLLGSEEDLPFEEPSRGATTMDEILGGPATAADLPDPEKEVVGLENLADSLYSVPDSAPEKTEEVLDLKSGVSDALADLFGEQEEESLAQVEPRIQEISGQSEDSPFADLLAGHDTENHEEGAVLGGDLAASLIDDPVQPLVTPEDKAEVQKPIQLQEESFSGGMSSALTNLFGSELEEDLSDLLDESHSKSSVVSDSEGSSLAATMTLAELYLSQGHGRDALQVYKELDAKAPSIEIKAKIIEIQNRIDSGEFGSF